jgi:hypothetical protein
MKTTDQPKLKLYSAARAALTGGDGMFDIGQRPLYNVDEFAQAFLAEFVGKLLGLSYDEWIEYERRYWDDLFTAWVCGHLRYNPQLLLPPPAWYAAARSSTAAMFGCRPEDVMVVTSREQMHLAQIDDDVLAIAIDPERFVDKPCDLAESMLLARHPAPLPDAAAFQNPRAYLAHDPTKKIRKRRRS